MRILLMRTSSMGDVVLTTPAARAVRHAFPDAFIGFLTDAAFVPLYAASPHVDAVIAVRRAALDRSPAVFLRDAAALRRRRFDVSVDLQRKPKTALLALAASIPRRIGGTILDSERVSQANGLHASERAVTALAPLGVASADLTLDVRVPPDDDAAAAWRMGQAGAGRDGRPVLGIFPGAGWRPRAWPPGRFAQIARRAARMGWHVVVVGAANEGDIVHEVVCGGGSRVAAMLDLPLGVLAGVLHRCSVFLSNDSGPMHLAMAVGAPTVGLFGPGDLVRFGPRVAPHAAVREPIACSPCRQFRDHCRNNACMLLIRVEQVWETLMALYQSTAKT
jgi:ADP-heptose:LPS heptosyltransferase